MNAKIIIIASTILGLSYIAAPLIQFEVYKGYCRTVVNGNGETYVINCLRALNGKD